MSKTAALSLPPSLEKSRQRHHWLDRAEPIAWVGSVAGTAAGVAFGQLSYAVAPVAIALSLNLTNRYRRLQQTPPETIAAIAQAQQLHLELKSLHHSLQALPLTQRIRDLEESLGRVSEVVVGVQQRQDELEAATERDRQQIKEAFAILKRGIYNLNNHTNTNFSDIRGEIQSLQQSLSTPPAPQSSPQILEETREEIARLRAELTALAEHSQVDLAPLQGQIEQVSLKIEQLEQTYNGVMKPGMRRIVRAVHKLQQPSISERPEANPHWLQDIAGRLEAALPHQYQLVTEVHSDWLLLALEQAQQELIVVSPWLTQSGTQFETLLHQLESALKRNVRVSIGWGDRSDIGQGGNKTKPITLMPKGWRYHSERDRIQRYSALPDLLNLKQHYGQLSLKLMGTHEKLLVCDRRWGLLGGQHLLCADPRCQEPDLGLHTTDPQAIEMLLARARSNPTTIRRARSNYDWETSQPTAEFSG